jgi:stress-induced morphogen
MVMGPIQKEIETRVTASFAPLHLELENESHTHNVPQGSESHFRLVVVSEKFVGQSRIQRQRLVNEVLRDLIAPGGIHALTQKTLTPQEWRESGQSTDGFVSPNCLGGSKK